MTECTQKADVTTLCTLWYCPPSDTKPAIESKYKLRPGPADLHFLMGSWSLRGIVYIYVWLESSYDPQECHPGQLVYTFLIRILSTSFILFQFSLSAITLGYLSRWSPPSFWKFWCRFLGTHYYSSCSKGYRAEVSPTDVYLKEKSRMSLWTSVPAALGHCVLCTIRLLDNASFGQCVLWTMGPLGNLSLWQCFP